MFDSTSCRWRTHKDKDKDFRARGSAQEDSSGATLAHQPTCFQTDMNSLSTGKTIQQWLFWNCLKNSHKFSNLLKYIRNNNSCFWQLGVDNLQNQRYDSATRQARSPGYKNRYLLLVSWKAQGSNPALRGVHCLNQCGRSVSVDCATSYRHSSLIRGYDHLGQVQMKVH